MTNEEIKNEIDTVTNKEEITTTEIAKQVDAVGAIEDLGLNAELAQFKMEKGDAWGAGADIDAAKEIFSNDYLIPKLWLIQSMSQLRIDGMANEGDFCNSIDGKIITDGETPLTFVVVNTFKRWQTFKIKENGKKEFVNSEAMTLENANYKYEFELDGFNHTRRQVLGFTVLLGKDLDKGLRRP